MPLLDSDQIFNQKSLLPGMLDDIEVRPLWAARFDLQIGNWNLPKLVNDFWRIYQNDAAGGRLISASGTIDLEPHAVYIIPAGLELSSRNEEPIAQFFIHFEFRGIPRSRLKTSFPDPCASRTIRCFRKSFRGSATASRARGATTFRSSA